MEQNEKNIQKDQELTKEELEQVNGGVTIQDILKSTTAILMFPWTHLSSSNPLLIKQLL